MRAIVIERLGGPDCPVYKDLPEPEPLAGHVEVKAFGLNHAEMHIRRGEWAEAAPVSGIECVGLVNFNPLLQMASGVYLTFFGSFVFGRPGFPLSDVPLQTIAEQAAAGRLRAKPSRVFRFEEMRDAHRVMEAGEASGKMVVVHG